MASRPVSAEVMAELSKYVCSLDVGQEKIFITKFNYRKWRKVCRKARLADLKFHDLRKHADTFIMPSKLLHTAPLSYKWHISDTLIKCTRYNQRLLRNSNSSSSGLNRFNFTFLCATLLRACSFNFISACIYT